MSIWRTTSRALILAAAAGLLTGCPTAVERTANQGGGSIITAGAKVVAGNMTTLTADEIQILGDEIAQRSVRFSGIEISDEQAEAAADFLIANDLDTVAEIQALVANPGGIEIPESVQALLDAGLATQ